MVAGDRRRRRRWPHRRARDPSGPPHPRGASHRVHGRADASRYGRGRGRAGRGARHARDRPARSGQHRPDRKRGRARRRKRLRAGRRQRGGALSGGAGDRVPGRPGRTRPDRDRGHPVRSGRRGGLDGPSRTRVRVPGGGRCDRGRRGVGECRRRRGRYRREAGRDGPRDERWGRERLAHVAQRAGGGRPGGGQCRGRRDRPGNRPGGRGRTRRGRHHPGRRPRSAA